jgi:cell division transport system permease protein
MFLSRPDIPFSADDSHRFMPWLIGMMAGLAALFLSLGLSVNHWVVDRHGEYSNSFTVNIPLDDNQADRVAKVQAALSKTPGVMQVTQVTDAKLKDMLKPWLGNSPMDDLPLPSVLDVTLVPGASKLNYIGLQKGLTPLAPGVEVDAHERWVSTFSEFSYAIRFVTLVLALLVIFGMAMTIAFTSRAALKLHSKTVHLLHTVGAADDYIMRQFQQEAVRVALPGACVGVAAAAILYSAMGSYIGSLKISLVPPLGLTTEHFILFFLLPIVCAGAAWCVARFSIALQLQRTL